MNPKIQITCTNFQLRHETQKQICDAAEKLFHQDIHVSEVRLTLEGDYNRRTRIFYKAVILLELRSSEIVVSDKADQLMPAVLSVVDQAERQLLERVYVRNRESAAVAARGAIVAVKVA